MRRSREAGRPWIVAFDEQRMGSNGIVTDAADDSRLDERRNHLYATLMAGSWSIEWYFGYESFPDDDLHLEDWRTRETIWRESNHAVEFFHQYLPFWETEPVDELTAREDDFVLAKAGEVYAVYVPDGGPTRLELPEGEYVVAWFDPREGGELVDGGMVTGPGPRSLGRPPADRELDWLALVRAK